MRIDLIRRIERKELSLFFAAPTGYLFVAAFLAVTLFVFFWGEAFFARNIADVRPMFEWMPVLLIFLSSALTMRMWSEERRTGTLEFVTTVPVSATEFVVGKFLACWLLLAVALVLTLPLPVTVDAVGDLDWGPVIAGYVASLLLGAAYLAVGLYVSAKSDSQIVSLIVSTAACGMFYLIGSPVLTDLVGGGVGDWMRAIGSGSRFESITRGVIDVRDLYYYVSIAAAFLALNVYALEQERWAADGNAQHHRAWRLGAGFLVANLLVANVWLGALSFLRVDVTEGRIYSISESTRGYLGQLREPLLIRGYFSEKTHPLLAPLVPRIKDLLTEYEVAGNGQVRVEVLDPAQDPEAEDEANTKYSIRPVPFQVADRYQSSLVNSYFDVLVQYGDEYEVLTFRDLIEVKVVGEGDLDVQLRNPEYDITRSIKKVLYGFQGGGSLFDSIADPVRFVGYVSADSQLPEALAAFRGVVSQTLGDLAADSGGKLDVEIVDPDAGGGQIAAEIAANYGFQPMMASLFDVNTFYFHLTLQRGDTVIQLPIPGNLTAEELTRVTEEGLKRFATGLLKSVALFAPEAPPPYMVAQGMAPPGNQFAQLEEFLRADFEVETTDLADGVVPDSADLLIVVDPTAITGKQLFAIDQFLMKGGTVAVSAGPFGSTIQAQTLAAVPRDTGLDEWLGHHGITLASELVMDPQNAAFPVPVTRQVGGFSFQEMRMLDYPYFVDARADGLNQDHPVTRQLPQLTIPWASPIEVSDDAAAARSVQPLVTSSAGSWTSADTNVMPRVTESGLSGFQAGTNIGSRTLGAVMEGRFESYFADKPSPLLESDDAQDAESEAEGDTDVDAADEEEDTLGVVTSTIAHSPESARLFLFASNDFLADQTLRFVGSANGTVYTNSVQLMANVVDFALEDQSLLSIRSRGNFNRTLPPMEQGQQSAGEYGNYAAALLGVGAVWLVYRGRRRRTEAVYRNWLGGQA